MILLSVSYEGFTVSDRSCILSGMGRIRPKVSVGTGGSSDLLVMPTESGSVYPMNVRTICIFMLAGLTGLSSASAGKKEDMSVDLTVETFRESSRVEPFFESSAGYAVFPTIGKGGIGLGGSHGKGRVYRGGKYIGDVSMTQVTIGFQFGGQAFSQIIFFEDEDALNEFISGNFEFGAQVSAVAITVGAEASASTAGSSAGVSTPSSSTHAADYKQGLAVFTYAKGGLMYEAAVGGQKFKYRPLKSE